MGDPSNETSRLAQKLSYYGWILASTMGIDYIRLNDGDNHEKQSKKSQNHDF